MSVGFIVYKVNPWDRIFYSILVSFVINSWVSKIYPWYLVLIHQVHIHFSDYNELSISPNNNHKAFTLQSKIKILLMYFMTYIFCIEWLLYYILLFPCMLQFVGVDPGLISSPWIFILNSRFLSLGNEKVRHFRKPWLKIMYMLDIRYELTSLRTARDKCLICTNLWMKL